MSIQWKRLTTLAIVLVLVVAAAAAYLLTGGGRTGTQVKAIFTSGVGVYVGSDVRVLGVRVGRIDSVVPQGPTVMVSMTVDPDVRIARDGHAVVIAPSVVSDRYIQLTAAKRGAATITSGATIALGQTATPVELDQLYSAIDDLSSALGPAGANKTGSLSQVLTVAAKNLKGNGATFNQTIKDFGSAAKTLDHSQADLFGTVANLKSFNDVLARNDAGVTQVNAQLASVSGYLAADRQDFAAATAQLSQALAQVQGFIHDNRSSITASVTGLQSTAQTLARQQAALQQISATLPVTLQNFLDAYDPSTGTLSSRGNLNDIGVWAGAPGAAGATKGAASAVPGAGSALSGTAGALSRTASGSSAPPPLFLPSVTGAVP